MAGRRRAGGLASAVDMMNKLMLNDMEQKREQQRLAQEYAQRLKIKALEQEFERGSLGFNLETGQIERREPQQAEIPTGMVPQSVSTNAQGQITGTRYAQPPQPKQPTPVNPATIINRLPLQPGGTDKEGQPKEGLDFQTALLDRKGQGISTFEPKLDESGKPVRTPFRALDKGFLPNVPVLGKAFPILEETPQASGFTGRELLGRVTSAIQNDPSVINRPSFQRVLSQSPELQAQKPQLVSLAQSIMQQNQPQAGGFQGGFQGQQNPEVIIGTPASAVAEGTVAIDDSTGQRWQAVGGQWVEI